MLPISPAILVAEISNIFTLRNLLFFIEHFKSDSVNHLLISTRLTFNFLSSNNFSTEKLKQVCFQILKCHNLKVLKCSNSTDTKK